MIIYIAGKITGNKNYKSDFAKAESKLTEQGHIVLNPAWLPSRGLTYGQYLNIGFAMLRESDAIYMLKGWQDSKGAVSEHSAAKIRGLKIIYEEDSNAKD